MTQSVSGRRLLHEVLQRDERAIEPERLGEEHEEEHDRGQDSGPEVECRAYVSEK